MTEKPGRKKIPYSASLPNWLKHLGTSINDVPRFLAIFYLPTLVLLNVPFWGLSWTPLPTLISDVINGLSNLHFDHFDITEETMDMVCVILAVQKNSKKVLLVNNGVP